jgi:hypothetical protein
MSEPVVLKTALTPDRVAPALPHIADRGASVQRRLHLEWTRPVGLGGWRARYGEQGLLELTALMSVYTMNANILRVMDHQGAAEARHLTPR